MGSFEKGEEKQGRDGKSVRTKLVPGVGRMPFPAYRGSEPYVFVSYAHKDAEKVYPELKRFNEAGYHVWYDEGIAPGNEWTDEIADALAGCAVFVVMLTPVSASRENVQNEINFALDEKKPFLAIHLEETELRRGLKLQIGTKQAILKYRMTEEEYEYKYISAFTRMGLRPVKEEKEKEREAEKKVQKTPVAEKSVGAAAHVEKQKVPAAEKAVEAAVPVETQKAPAVEKPVEAAVLVETQKIPAAEKAAEAAAPAEKQKAPAVEEPAETAAPAGVQKVPVTETPAKAAAGTGNEPGKGGSAPGTTGGFSSYTGNQQPTGFSNNAYGRAASTNTPGGFIPEPGMVRADGRTSPASQPGAKKKNWVLLAVLGALVLGLIIFFAVRDPEGNGSTQPVSKDYVLTGTSKIQIRQGDMQVVTLTIGGVDDLDQIELSVKGHGRGLVAYLQYAAESRTYSVVCVGIFESSGTLVIDMADKTTKNLLKELTIPFSVTDENINAGLISSKSKLDLAVGEEDTVVFTAYGNFLKENKIYLSAATNAAFSVTWGDWENVWQEPLTVKGVSNYDGKLNVSLMSADDKAILYTETLDLSVVKDKSYDTGNYIEWDLKTVEIKQGDTETVSLFVSELDPFRIEMVVKNQMELSGLDAFIVGQQLDSGYEALVICTGIYETEGDIIVDLIEKSSGKVLQEIPVPYEVRDTGQNAGVILSKEEMKLSLGEEDSVDVILYGNQIKEEGRVNIYWDDNEAYAVDSEWQSHYRIRLTFKALSAFKGAVDVSMTDNSQKKLFTNGISLTIK